MLGLYSIMSSHNVAVDRRGPARPAGRLVAPASIARAISAFVIVWPLAGEYNYNISVQAYGYGTYSVVPVRVCGYPVHVVR